MARYCTRPAVSEGRHHLVSDHKWMLHSIVQWLSEEHSQAGRTISRFKPESPFRELRELKAQFQFVGRSLIIRPLRRQRMPAFKRHKYVASYIIISYVLKTENHYMKLYKTIQNPCNILQNHGTCNDWLPLASKWRAMQSGRVTLQSCLHGSLKIAVWQQGGSSEGREHAETTNP